MFGRKFEWNRLFSVTFFAKYCWCLAHIGSNCHFFPFFSLSTFRRILWRSNSHDLLDIFWRYFDKFSLKFSTFTKSAQFTAIFCRKIHSKHYLNSVALFPSIFLHKLALPLLELLHARTHTVEMRPVQLVWTWKMNQTRRSDNGNWCNTNLFTANVINPIENIRALLKWNSHLPLTLIVSACVQLFMLWTRQCAATIFLLLLSSSFVFVALSHVPTPAFTEWLVCFSCLFTLFCLKPYRMNIRRYVTV